MSVFSVRYDSSGERKSNSNICRFTLKGKLAIWDRNHSIYDIHCTMIEGQWGAGYIYSLSSDRLSSKAKGTTRCCFTHWIQLIQRVSHFLRYKEHAEGTLLSLLVPKPGYSTCLFPPVALPTELSRSFSNCWPEPWSFSMGTGIPVRYVCSPWWPSTPQDEAKTAPLQRRLFAFHRMLIPDQGLYLKNANRLFEATYLVQPDPDIAFPSLAPLTHST